MNTYKLLTPGPLTTTDTVKQEMMVDHCTWDEDYKNGSHYHCMMPEWNNKHDESEESHFKAGMVMPEPWASMYRGY